MRDQMMEVGRPATVSIHVTEGSYKATGRFRRRLRAAMERRRRSTYHAGGSQAGVFGDNVWYEARGDCGKVMNMSVGWRRPSFSLRALIHPDGQCDADVGAREQTPRSLRPQTLQPRIFVATGRTQSWLKGCHSAAKGAARAPESAMIEVRLSWMRRGVLSLACRVC